MSNEGYIPRPLEAKQLRQLVLEAIQTLTHNPETYHALYDHLERGLSSDDVIHVLESEWEFGRPPRFNREEWQWKYEIDGESVDGDPITVIIAVDTVRREFVVVTRWRDESQLQE
jgi:hypothetical protein